MRASNKTAVSKGKDNQSIVAFFAEGTIPENRGDCSGMTREQILQWETTPESPIEERQSFLHWLFPIREPDHIYYNAPVTTGAAIAECRQNPGFHRQMVENLEVMASFYGGSCTFEAETGELLKIKIDQPNKIHRLHWHQPFQPPFVLEIVIPSQHFGRITRILTSLKQHGLQGEAKKFYQFLASVAPHTRGNISDEILTTWYEAAYCR